jgi:hypothetical protein
VTPLRHCEPTVGAKRRPLREAIQRQQDWIASSQELLAMTLC